jgi:O-antigen ligase
LALQLNLSAGGEWNLVGRVLFYKRAVDLFWESPIFGIGFGRYNDPLTDCSMQLDNLLCVMEASDTYFLEKNAHNSYLQYLSELGIVGFVLFVTLWIFIFSCIRRGIRLATQNSQKKTEAYFHACEAVFFTLPASALFGHAYGAPQVGIPILSVIGIGLGFVNFMSWRRD